jgi:predicted N-acyltransferase
MRISIHDRIADIGEKQWNRLAGDEWPFLRFEFLAAAEHSGSVSAAEGWQPCHLAIADGDGLRAALPLYRKTHSWGEFVFDWAWANAYHRAGFEYYPKLVSTVPFTPATSARLLLRDSNDAAAAAALLEGATGLAADTGCSSVHVLFPDELSTELLARNGFKLRRDCQFHWENRDYADFDAFLASFSSRKRKKARRERRKIAEAGVHFRRLTGADLTADDWRVVYDLISRTFMARGSLPYFRRGFFEAIGRELAEQVLVILAEEDNDPIAAAIFFVGPDTLYGRYWGTRAHYDSLHFETCYYQGIDYCIENRISRFEPGTQGEHKISRGFLPTEVRSAHWLAQPEFFSAIGDYVDEEARHVARYMEAVDEHSPYRRDDT